MLKLTIHKQISMSVILNNFVTVGLKQKQRGMELECKEPVSHNCWWQIQADGHPSGIVISCIILMYHNIVKNMYSVIF